MKTAVQELIEFYKNNHPFYSYTKDDIIKVLQLYIEKEKEQIADAFRNGSTSSMLGGGHWTQYYNQTYNQEPKKEYQPSEEYLKKQKELMEDFIWNKMNKNNQNK
jgi:hypothetical protein